MDAQVLETVRNRRDRINVICLIICVFFGFHKYMKRLCKSVQKQSQRADLQVLEIQLFKNGL